MLIFILFTMNMELKKSVHAKIQHLISAYKNLLTYYIKLLLNAALIVVVFLCVDSSDPRCRMKKCYLMMFMTSGRPLASKLRRVGTHSVCVFVHPSVVEV